MKGIAILYAAMWRIFTNLDVAFRASLVWVVGMIVGLMITIAVFSILPSFFRIALPFALIAVLLLFSAIIAISWHRFCLLGHRAFGFFSLPDMKLLKSYLKAALKVIFIAILIFIPALILVFFGALVIGIAGNDFVATVYEAGINILAGAIVAGISVFLPAAALEKSVSGTQVRDLIFEHFGALLSLSFAYYLLSVGVSLVISNFGAARFPIGFGLEFVALIAFSLFSSWFLFMLSIGYISELYGVYFIDEVETEV